MVFRCSKLRFSKEMIDSQTRSLAESVASLAYDDKIITMTTMLKIFIASPQRVVGERHCIKKLGVNAQLASFDVFDSIFSCFK